MHIISLCLWISYDIILWYVVADDVDVTCCFLLVAGTFVISFSMIEQKQSIRAWMWLHVFGTNLNQRLDAVCLLIVVPKWKRTVLPKWKHTVVPKRKRIVWHSAPKMEAQKCSFRNLVAGIHI